MHARFSLILAAALIAASTLSACDSRPGGSLPPYISFSDKRPIQLDVGQLEITPEYQSPGRLPNIEHLIPISPEAGTVRWAQDRLRPMGRSGYARVLIKDAHVVESQLPVDKGVSGLFKEQQAQRYEANLEVAVQILDERHMPVADVVARASRVKSVPEGLSLNERDRILTELTESLVRDIDSQMDGLIHSYMGRWIVN